jgi:nuclear polyadenylated RNA-binding protein 3
MPDRGGRQGRNSGVDRYDGRSAPNVRVDEYGRPLRSRDDYRPVRSPTPPRANFRGRDDYGPRGRDSYGRDRRHSRSRSPYGHRDNGRYRERSLSPRMREANEDTDLQIPRRDARDVPDVQIILMEQLDRAFVSWVEGEMRARGVKTEAMFLSPRLPLQAVIRRQILEGVHAVSQLDMRSQSSSKIPLQVFDRQAGANNVRFDEYRDLDPKIAAELVLRSKQTAPQITAQPYVQPQFAPPNQSYQPPVPAQAPAPAATNLANLVGQLDNATLQKLLGTLNTPQQQNAPAAASNSAIDLAGLLGGLKQAPPAPQQPPQQSYQPQVNLYGNPAANPLASLLGNSAPQQPQQGQPEQSAQQVQNIMAQLARFRQ